MAGNLADIELYGELHKHLAEIQHGPFAIEALQALDQRRRNNQNRVGIVKIVPDQQARTVLDWRRHEVQVHSEPGQRLGHDQHDNGDTMENKMNERIVVITGASGVLGEAVTGAFLNGGAGVFGISHRANTAKDPNNHPSAPDLTSSNAAGDVT